MPMTIKTETDFVRVGRGQCGQLEAKNGQSWSQTGSWQSCTLKRELFEPSGLGGPIAVAKSKPVGGRQPLVGIKDKPWAFEAGVGVRRGWEERGGGWLIKVLRAGCH